MDEAGPVAAAIGAPAFAVVDAGVLPLLEPRLRRSFAQAAVTLAIAPFEGEITFAAIARLADLADAPGVVLGVGGGKGIDAGKGVSARLGVPVMSVPTIASSDAPTSSVFPVYDENHTIVSVERLPRNPAAVLVDTGVIARAPARFLRAGIGDAVGKTFEAQGCAAGTGHNAFGTRPLLLGGAVAETAYRTLRRHAAAALADVGRGAVTEAVESTVEACLLMSGLGFENGGLSLAHAMARGLVRARGTAAALHGEQVAYALLVQLAAEQRPDAEIVELMGFHRSVGLPVRLAELGMADPTDPELAAIAEWTMTAPYILNAARPVSAPAIAEALRHVEDLAAA